MKIRLTARTMPNGFAHGADTEYLWTEADHEDWQSAIDNLVEYSARVCYKSTDRMRTSPNFIQKRIAEGHEDVIEHGWVVFSFSDMDYGEFINAIYWKHIAEDLQYMVPHGYSDEVLIGGNMRSWLQLVRSGVGPSEELLPYLCKVAPKVFEPYQIEYNSPQVGTGHNNGEDAHVWKDHWGSSIHSGTTPSGANVSLLSYTMIPGVDDRIQFPPRGDRIQHATFLIEGVSRSLTHQLIRHRRMSFSQESQRYVDLSKGDWGIVIPPAIADSIIEYSSVDYGNLMDSGTVDNGKDYMIDRWNMIKGMYAELRSSGIRKEDARFLLPNMTETRLVVSGPLHTWKHFLWQRADKAAQWEIRDVTIEILKQLDQAFPHTFAKEMEAFGLKEATDWLSI